jgi:hypothetical protein
MIILGLGAVVRSKQAAGSQDLVEAELGKLHGYLLGPARVMPAPRTIELAVASYRAARMGGNGGSGCGYRGRPERP